MESFLILLLIILLFGIIIIPIVSLVKISSIGSRLAHIENELKQLKIPESKILSAVDIKEPEPEIKEEITIAEPVQPDIPVEKVEEPTPATVVCENQEESVLLPETELQEEIREEFVAEAEIEEPEPSYMDIEVKENPEVPVYTMPAIEETSVADTPPFDKPKAAKPISASYRFENLLSKIGIVTLVLGIAFFVKYAIDKDWINEVGRVAIGIFTGGILIGIAHKLRKKYDIFSALMVGGGISVFYITITLAFREYQLFGQTLAFAILIAITIFSVILSLIYDRKELALFSLLGGYASPLMISTGEGNFVVLFSFIFILNSGMLIISMRKKWRIIGLVSFLCTLLFYWGWLLGKFENQYAGALTFAMLFFAQFYLLALFDHFRSDRKVSPFQVGVILANNLSLFVASIYIFNETEMKIQGLITISMAIVNAIVMLVLFRKATVDKRLIYLIIAIVLSFVSLAIPVQLNGHVITMFWAAEIVILLWLWRKSGIKVFHIGFLLISGLTLVSYLMDACHIYFELNGQLPVVFNRMFITGLVVVVAFVVSRFMLTRMGDEQQGIVDLKALRQTLTSIIFGMAYLVPFLEIYYQFENSPVKGIYLFTTMMLAVYTTIYVMVLCILFTKKIQQSKSPLTLLFVFVIMYLAFALPAIIDLRSGVFYAGQHQSLFLVHYLSLPALAYIFYVIIKGIRKLSKQSYTICGWLLAACAVVILSVELDSTIIQLWGTAANYDELLYDVHTFGYPILWGILAMILMVWGLKAKEVLLRQISLGFFAFIILKFYISDIWLMSQTGRIISFVVLGVILLLVSFLIQKIKVLIKDDEEPSTPDERVS